MKSKNSRPPDALEEAYLEDVKRVPCVSCNKVPSEAHHPEQGLHFLAIAWCRDCHRGPDGWHGTRSALPAKVTVMKAINETRRRVDMLRSGAPITLMLEPIPPTKVKVYGVGLSSDKIIKQRRY